MKNPSILKVGVIGFGSIGTRHCENLIKLGVTDITLYRARGKENQNGFKEIYNKSEFLSARYDFIILSNPSALHYKFLEKLITNQVNVLVEKPIAAKNSEFENLKTLLINYTGIGMIAFNMRFHPCVKKTKEILDSKVLGKAFSARFFVGQYLPDWHPGTDYRNSYSSFKKLGGGVVFDLIHEIDLAYLLCGKVLEDFHAIIGKVSDLEIETEDLAEIHYKSNSNAFVSIHLDYLTRGYSRYFEIICEKGRICCDLFKNEIKLIRDKNEIPETFTYPEFNRNDMYVSMMEYYLKNIENKTYPIPSLSEGLISLEIALKAKLKSNEHEGSKNRCI
jgi:predicted dehydrogenase